MIIRSLVLKYASSRGLPIVTAVSAVAIFILGTIIRENVALGVLYVPVVLLAC